MVAQMVKVSACSAGDPGSILWRRKCNSLQYSCLENPMDGGAWWATVCGVAKSRTRLSDFTFTFHEGKSENFHNEKSFLHYTELLGGLLLL